MARQYKSNEEDLRIQDDAAVPDLSADTDTFSFTGPSGFVANGLPYDRTDWPGYLDVLAPPLTLLPRCQVLAANAL